MSDYAVLALGVLCAGGGGELFVRGLLGLASWARVPARIAASTLAAFATSSPELTIAVNSALAGEPEISLGDALGSNVVNVALILAIAAVIARIPAPPETLRRDFPAALLTPFLVGALAYDGALGRADGVVLLCAFFLWLGGVVAEARRERARGAAAPAGDPPSRATLIIVVGLALLVVAGRLVVAGAEGIGARTGTHLFVIGATLVALGTSVPELAIAVVSQLRRRHDVGLGTILGSNVFNGLFIIAVAALIQPIPVAWSAVRVPLAFGVVAVAAILPGRAASIDRRRGVFLVGLYALYAATLSVGT
ncbi:MAG TPA: calcium/sodium antiporter [Myxococcota bacterium]|nr:calcium/sodium antiporter [Myxococcota bacterium]